MKIYLLTSILSITSNLGAYGQDTVGSIIGRNDGAGSIRGGERNRNLEAIEENVKYDDIPYADIQKALNPWEEIAMELISNDNGPKSATDNDSYLHETRFKILRPKTKGARINKLSFLTELDGELIMRVTASFTDGSSDTGGIDPDVKAPRGTPGIETVYIPGVMTGTIKVVPRLYEGTSNNNHRVGQVTIGAKTVSTTNDYPADPKYYDVDNRFLMGLIVSTGNDRNKNLSFIVSKKIISSSLTNVEYTNLKDDIIDDAKTLDTITLRNEGATTQSFAVSYTQIEESSISLSSEETISFGLGLGIETTFEAGTPFVGVKGTASVETHFEKSFSSGKTEETVSTVEVTKEVFVEVPPKTVSTLIIQQYQVQIQDIKYTAEHTVTFEDGTSHHGTVEGKMEGVAVSNVFIKTTEEPL